MHATASQEAVDIEQCLSNTQKVFVVQNLTEKLPYKNFNLSRLTNVNRKALQVAFLSRIHPKKNLDFAICCLKEVTENASFNIYGPIDDHEYWEKCRSLLSGLPKNVSFTYHGAIEHSEVPSRLKDNDLLFFPTRNENFGHVIIEAIQAGLLF